VNKTEKEQLREELHHIFNSHPYALVLSFSGLKVNDVAALRRKLRDSKCAYRVVKNTVAKIAADGTPMASLLDHFEGTTAIAYHPSDPVVLAKIFHEFTRENKAIGFKGILLEGRPLPADQLEMVVNMPTKDQSLSKLLFLLNYPVTSLARVLQASLRDLCLVMKEARKES